MSMEPASQQSLNQPIDRTRFSDQLAIAGVIVDATKVNVILSKHRQLLYNQKGVRNVYEMPDAEGQRAVLLNPEMSWETLEPLLTQILEVENLPRTTQHITKKYEDYSYFEALKLLLPPEVTTPSGFEVIGHIAHLNLRKDQIPFQFVIGQVIRDKTAGIRTVVNKTDKLHNVYRTPELELISGEGDYETKLHEGKVSMTLNFEKVYWCSKLHSERDRVLQEITEKDVVCDAFCGVGPFSLRAAKEKGATVYASDLNPECFRYLEMNVIANKLQGKVHPSNACARQYIQDCLLRSYTKETPALTRFYMNLPAMAIEFLDSFCTFFGQHPEYLQEELFQNAIVHVYCFRTKSIEDLIKADLVDRIQLMMPNFNDKDILNVHVLKSVSSEKDMCCISFKLTSCNANPVALDLPEKKLKIDLN